MSVVGSEGLAALNRRLREAEAKGLQRELRRGLLEGAAPLIPVAHAAARTELPRRGGLADRVGARPVKVRVSFAKSPSVRIAVAGTDAGSTNRGRLRHPTFGHRDRWVNQAIKPGWFTDSMRQAAPTVRPRLVAAMERVAQQIAR